MEHEFEHDFIIIGPTNDVGQKDSVWGKSHLLANLLKSVQGRQRIASSMVAPLRTTLDYASIGRKTFLVEQLPDGASPIFSKDDSSDK